MRAFRSGGVVAACFAFAAACAAPPPPAAAGWPASVRRLGLAAVDAHHAVVVLDLTEPLAASVELAKDGAAWAGGPKASAPAALHHELALDGLEEGARYRYRVILGAAPALETDRGGRALTLATAPPATASVTALLIADLQAGRYDELLPELSRRDDLGFVLSLGDHVGLHDDPVKNGPAQYLDYLLGPLGAVTARAPLFAAIGNHDLANARDAKVRAAALAEWRAHMVLPPGTLPGEEERVYSFEWGPLHVAVLDSLDAAKGEGWGVVGADELAWLAADLGRSTRRWKVVALHHVVHGTEAPPGQEQAAWFQVSNAAEVHAALRAAGVNLVLSGHRHAAMCYVLDGIRYVVAPTLSREKILPLRPGRPDWTPVGGEPGTFPRGYGDVFGYGVLHATPERLDIEPVTYAADKSGLVPAAVPRVSLP